MSTHTVHCTTVFLQDYNSNADKFYRAYAIGNWCIFQHGARGVVGAFIPKEHPSPAAAQAAADKQIAAKQAKGYRDLTFVTFAADPARLDGSKERCIQLDDIRQAATGNSTPNPSLPPLQGTGNAHTPPPTATDPFGAFTSQALNAITLAVTDPAKGAEQFALLNAAWPELDQIHSKARSYLNTLDSLVMGVNA